MAVRTSFTAGEVLAAADLTDTFGSKIDYALATNAQSGTGASAYTFVLADANRLTTATGATAKTFTIPPQASVAWAANSIIRVVNYGAGDLTIAGGAGVTVTNATKTLAQYESAALIRTASNAWTLVPFSGGVGNADFSDAATGTYSDGGINYKYKTYTGSGSVTITKAGLCDVLVVGGGAGGGCFRGGGGGAGGYFAGTSVYFATGTETVVVGAGGTGAPQSEGSRPAGGNGLSSRIGNYYGVGGGGGAGGGRGGIGGLSVGGSGGSGGGGGGSTSAVGGSGTSGQGNSGGTAAASSAQGAGGGGGANANGSNGTTSVGGDGGAGLSSSITNSAVTRSGGGGGGSNGGTAGSGGSGGGGAGTNNTGTGAAGTANTGGGGGGGGYSGGAGGSGGNGGSGVVIIRVRTN